MPRFAILALSLLLLLGMIHFRILVVTSEDQFSYHMLLSQEE